MFRETLQTLACLSVLVGTSSLHMARDAYRPMTELDVTNVGNTDTLSSPLSSTQNNKYRQVPSTSSISSSPSVGGVAAAAAGTDLSPKSIVSALTSSESQEQFDNELRDVNANLPSSMLQYALHKEPPRALQELFSGASALDIRLEQQQLQQQQLTRSNQPPPFQQKLPDFTQIHQIKRTSSDGNDGDADDSSSGGANSGVATSSNLPVVPHGIANQFMLRSSRGQRQYDVPQIGKSTLFFTYYIH